MPIILDLVGEWMSVSVDIFEKSCQKGSSEHYFGSVCHLLGDWVALNEHRKQKMAGNKRNRPTNLFTHTLKQSFLNMDACGQKGQTAN